MLIYPLVISKAGILINMFPKANRFGDTCSITNTVPQDFSFRRLEHFNFQKKGTRGTVYETL